MKQRRPLFIVLIISVLLSGCSERELDMSTPSNIATPEVATEGQGGAQPPQERPKRRAMNATERRAISEARSRRAPLEPPAPISPTLEGSESDLGTTVRGAPPETNKGDTGLTQYEKMAALDDPAVNLPKGSVKAEAPLPPSSESPMKAAKRDTTSPRPGVELRGGAKGLKLIDLAISAEVRKREPTGVQERFNTLPRRFHCFCVFENRQQITEVTHIWRRDGRVVSRVELEVGKSPKWRTWSKQRLKPEWTGEWSCEVQTKEGKTLGKATVRAGR